MKTDGPQTYSRRSGEERISTSSGESNLNSAVVYPIVSSHWLILANMLLKLWVPWNYESSSIFDRVAKVVILWIFYCSRFKWIYVLRDVRIFFKVNISRKIIYFRGVIWGRHITQLSSRATLKLNLHYQTQSESVQQIVEESQKLPIIHLTCLIDTVQRKQTKNIDLFLSFRNIPLV
jgi:hypothetical protein